MTTTSRHPLARSPMLRAAALLVLLGIFTSHAPTGLAQEDDGNSAAITWGIRPSSAEGPDGRNAFEYTLDPGDTIEDYIGVSNFTDQPIDLAVYASDAFTSPAGDFDLLPAADPPVDVGAWITFAEPVVTVPPRSRLDIPFLLSIPANATPGDHPGGIVASLTMPEADANDSRVAVDRRVGARVYLRVTGELDPRATIDDVAVDYEGNRNPFGDGRATVTYTIANAGNVRFTGTPVVELAGPFGVGRRVAATAPIPELLPGFELAFSTTIDSALPLGRLTATVTFTPEPIVAEQVESVPTATGEVTTWAMPWTQLALVALVVLALVASRRHRKRRKQRLAAQLEAAKAEGREAALSARE